MTNPVAADIARAMQGLCRLRCNEDRTSTGAADGVVIIIPLIAIMPAAAPVGDSGPYLYLLEGSFVWTV